jgi:hypothetical protein
MAGKPEIRVQRQMMIHTVVQVFFILLLLYVAWHFQQVFTAKGEAQIFYNSLFFTFVLQAALFYPIYRFAANEARGEISAQTATTPEQLQALRKKRILGDLLKAVAFIFYATFIALSPPATFVLSTTFFSFIATTVTYLQSFNYCAKRIMVGENPALTLRKKRT